MFFAACAGDITRARAPAAHSDATPRPRARPVEPHCASDTRAESTRRVNKHDATRAPTCPRADELRRRLAELYHLDKDL